MSTNQTHSKIVLHHIGAAGMTYPFKNRSAFFDDFIVYLYDADKAVFTGSGVLKEEIIHACIGKEKERRKFYTTYERSASSLLKVNPEYASWYFDTYGDFYIGDITQIIDEKEIDAVSLDATISCHNAISPDIISIDAEGMSYDILVGAEESIKNTVAIICEVEFGEIRLGQKTFFDVGNLLKEQFVFAGFVGRAYDYSPHRNPLGFRGNSICVTRDALFLRKKTTICNDYSLAKLAFVAFAYGFIEYGFYAVLDIDKDIFAENLHYLQLIDELIRLYKNEDHIYKLSLKDINKTQKDAKNRYIRNHTNLDTDFLQKKYTMEMKFLSLQDKVTDVEKLFYKYEMPDIAQIIHKRNQEKFYIK